jgi:hypothetical protein
MTLLHLLASGPTGPKTLWDPTIVGILAVVSGVFLFCGSTYLLLATNLGARLGFRVAISGLSGFMVLLSIVWVTTSTPLNSPKGREATWNGIEVVSDPSESSISDVHDILETEPLTLEDAGAVKPFVDASLVTANTPANEEPPEQPLAEYSSASEFITDSDTEDVHTYVTGGETKAIFWHEAEYAAAEFCDVATKPNDPALEFGEVVTPRCLPGAPKRYLILQHDLGSIRLPPLIYLIGSSVVFALSLLSLQWYEKDLRARRREAALASA